MRISLKAVSALKSAKFIHWPIIALGLIAGAFINPAPLAAKERVEVKVDHAQVLKISKPAATVIIGNPGIADATVQDKRTLVITGKSFGITNMIIMDEEGDVIVDALLTVQGDAVDAVTIYRRTQRITYSCSPNCERSLTLGDAAEDFGAVRSQVEERNAFSTPTQ